MQNNIIRKKARENKVPIWKIAQVLGVSEATMTRRLRIELPAEERDKVCSIIEAISAATTQGVR